MSSRVSATEAARHFSDLLNRVLYGREEFVIVRGGAAVGQLVPAPPERPTLGELLRRLASLDRPDAGFASDLAEIQERQPRLEEPPEWRS